MEFNKILVTGFSRSNLDKNTWARISKIADKIVFAPSADVDCLFSRFNKIVVCNIPDYCTESVAEYVFGLILEHLRDLERAKQYESLDKLISSSDFLSLHILTTKETEGILDARRINSIKKGTFVINVSGMKLINLPALEKRLEKNDITFIFDHPDEMDKQDVDRLTKYKNCIVYPPIGYITKEAMVSKQDIFVSNLENFLKGKPINIVT